MPLYCLVSITIADQEMRLHVRGIERESAEIAKRYGLTVMLNRYPQTQGWRDHKVEAIALDQDVLTAMGQDARLFVGAFAVLNAEKEVVWDGVPLYNFSSAEEVLEHLTQHMLENFPAKEGYADYILDVSEIPIEMCLTKASAV